MSLSSAVSRARGTMALFGPAFVAAIAYVDPGNVATNVTAGAVYGYLLVWVVVLANLMACLVQYLSAKFGLATGATLPETLRDRLSNRGRLAYWVQAEVVAMATDLAEVLGGAIALNILFDLPLLLGGVITAVVSTAMLLVQDRRGQRAFERVITTLLVIIAAGFFAGLFVAPPPAGAVVSGLVPAFDGSGSVLLAAGMLGATVMPHAVYLHSALARDRHGRPSPAHLPKVLRATRFDVGAAMLLAGAVNLAMLLVAATSLGGSADELSLQAAHDAVGQSLGGVVAAMFAIGLLASGLASTSVGCYAGAVVMAGLLRRSIPLLLRRVITMVPAVIILALGVDPTLALVISQVVLSFGLPFVLIPLVSLTRSRAVMGPAANHPVTTVVAVVVVALVIALNLTLIWLTITGG
ncbi:Nramp family divalent metal transporter [Nakamurella sp.]|uniref:Nramp family divalent metal transporter n=1 Tax=Nakamurella sp. TaxID=1869182 RepID=UPI00378526F8